MTDLSTDEVFESLLGSIVMIAEASISIKKIKVDIKSKDYKKAGAQIDLLQRQIDLISDYRQKKCSKESLVRALEINKELLYGD